MQGRMHFPKEHRREAFGTSGGLCTTGFHRVAGRARCTSHAHSSRRSVSAIVAHHARVCRRELVTRSPCASSHETHTSIGRPVPSLLRVEARHWSVLSAQGLSSGRERTSQWPSVATDSVSLLTLCLRSSCSCVRDWSIPRTRAAIGPKKEGTRELWRWFRSLHGAVGDVARVSRGFEETISTRLRGRCFRLQVPRGLQ